MASQPDHLGLRPAPSRQVFRNAQDIAIRRGRADNHAAGRPQSGPRAIIANEFAFEGQRHAGIQDLCVPIHVGLSKCGKKLFVGLADDFACGAPHGAFAKLVDQQILPCFRILYEEHRRHLVYDRVEKRPRFLALSRKFFPVGDIPDDRREAAPDIAVIPSGEGQLDREIRAVRPPGLQLGRNAHHCGRPAIEGPRIGIVVTFG